MCLLMQIILPINHHHVCLGQEAAPRWRHLRRLVPDPSTRGDGLFARLSAGMGNPHRGYINQPEPAPAGSWLVPAGLGSYRDRLRPGPGLAKRAGTTRGVHNHYAGEPGGRRHDRLSRHGHGAEPDSPAESESRARPTWLCQAGSACQFKIPRSGPPAGHCQCQSPPVTVASRRAPPPGGAGRGRGARQLRGQR